jgi:soluble P-type ATPase
MSVVCRLFEEQTDGFTEPLCTVYCKGSPEKIGRLCRPESLPDDFHTVLSAYAGHGYRLLALATKRIPVNLAKTARINRLARSEIESGLDFCGLIVLENRLKPASADVLKELHNAQIRPVMVTGDNILTAICVAQDCGLVPPSQPIIRVQAATAANNNKKAAVDFSLLPAGGKAADSHSEVINMEKASALDYCYAIDGPSFEIICKDYKEEVLPLLLSRGSVFARMQPDMKQHLVGLLQGLGYYVAMCGDGANDCGALKAAHVGISLSEAEASVASPFTSRRADISCVPQLVKEGRAALVTSFSIFKYMAGYSITQFISVMILYEVYSNLSDMQYLYIDLFVITSLASVLGVNKTNSGRLTARPPLNSLIAVQPLFSLLSQLAIVIVFQFCCLYYTRLQDWFVPFDYENSCYYNTTAEENFNNLELERLGKCEKEENPVASYENYAIFSVSQFQYIILAVVFAKGAPFRESSLKNFPMVATVSVLTAFSLYLVINPHGPVLYQQNFGFELFLPPPEYMSFRLLLVAMVAGNLGLAFLCEIFLADGLVQRIFRGGQKPADKVAEQLLSSGNSGWPQQDGVNVDATIKTVGSFAILPPFRSPRDDVLIVEKNIDTPSRAFEDLFSGVATAATTKGKMAANNNNNNSVMGSPSQAVPLLACPPSAAGSPLARGRIADGQALVDMPALTSAHMSAVNAEEADAAAAAVVVTSSFVDSTAPIAQAITSAPHGRVVMSASHILLPASPAVTAPPPGEAAPPPGKAAAPPGEAAPPPEDAVPPPWLPSLPQDMEICGSQETAIEFPSYPTKNIAVTEPEITKEISKI